MPMLNNVIARGTSQRRWSLRVRTGGTGRTENALFSVNSAISLVPLCGGDEVLHGLGFFLRFGEVVLEY